jgi:hypothetical protein
MGTISQSVTLHRARKAFQVKTNYCIFSPIVGNFYKKFFLSDNKERRHITFSSLNGLTDLLVIEAKSIFVTRVKVTLDPKS